jgi:hypothetical protein
MIKDLIELRKANWVPRKGGLAPAADPVMKSRPVDRYVFLILLFWFLFTWDLN